MLCIVLAGKVGWGLMPLELRDVEDCSPPPQQDLRQQAGQQLQGIKIA